MRGTDMRQTIMLMAACAALLASCTNEVGEGLGIDTPIQVTASVEGIMTTRAENTKDNLDNFGLYIKDKDGNYTEPYGGENILAEKDNGTWTLGTTVLYQGNGQTYYAYAPYQSIEAGATSVDFSIKTDQSGSEYMQASDLLYAAGNVDDPTLAITFSHKLSKLTVTLTAEDFAEDEVSFTGVTLRGTLPTTTLNLTNGAVSTASGDATDIQMWESSTNTYECILVPQAATYSVLIKATVEGEQKTYVYTPSAAYTFESDQSYTLALKVKKADEPTAIESINVKGWGDDGNAIALEDGEIGDGYSYDASTNTYTVSSAKGLKAWAEAARGGYWRNPVNCTLAADIDMTKESWTAIRLNDGGLYTGVIEGNGHTITGLTDCLLEINNGTVRNLTFIEPNISSSFYAGAVTGENGGTIENCHVVGGSIESTWYQSGGIAGVHGGRRAIRACSSTATVTSNENAGGIVGYIQGPVLACYATGSVSGSNNSGAIVGENDNGTITACYWSGTAEKGVGNGNGSADGTTKVEGNDWTAAMNTMNTALDGSGYQWIENPDDKTGKHPLVIVTR